MEFVHALSDGVAGFASSPYALWFLFILAFTESSFFPIPPDVLMIPLALANPVLALLYATIATAASVLGGAFGYWLGLRGGRPLLKKFANGNKVKMVERYFQKYDVWAVGMAAFTPIPYKLFTISAGVFNLNFKRFMIASLVGRGGRFFAVGIMIWLFGPTIKLFLENYFELTILGFSLLLVGGFVVVAKLSSRAAEVEIEPPTP